MVRGSAASLCAVSYGTVVVFPHLQPDPRYLNVTAVPKSSATMSAKGASCGFLDNIVPALSTSVPATPPSGEPAVSAESGPSLVWSPP